MISKLLKDNGGTGRIRTAGRDFADLGLTTWRRCPVIDKMTGKKWSGRRGSNPRLQPWQGCTLPLSYSRDLSNLRGVPKPLIIFPLLRLSNPIF
jgi:hypothetical protein